MIDIKNYILSLDYFQNIDNFNDKRVLIFENIQYITLKDCLNNYNKEEILSDFKCENCNNKGIIKNSRFITYN